MNRPLKKIKSISINWQTEKFLKKNRTKIPKTQGVYMFVLDIENRIDINGTCKYVLYIGQTKNLYQRFNTYFTYK